ncbi:hypothetical protein ES703_53447 [subsurface metagenome]
MRVPLFLNFSSLYPYFPSLAFASLDVRPLSPASKASKACSTDSWYHLVPFRNLDTVIVLSLACRYPPPQILAAINTETKIRIELK